MSCQTLALRIAGTIFALMSAGQFIRLLTKTDIVIAGFALPLWPSALATLVAGSLSFGMWHASFGTRKQTISP